MHFEPFTFSAEDKAKDAAREAAAEKKRRHEERETKTQFCRNKLPEALLCHIDPADGLITSKGEEAVDAYTRIRKVQENLTSRLQKLPDEWKTIITDTQALRYANYSDPFQTATSRVYDMYRELGKLTKSVETVAKDMQTLTILAGPTKAFTEHHISFLPVKSSSTPSGGSHTYSMLATAASSRMQDESEAHPRLVGVRRSDGSLRVATLLPRNDRRYLSERQYRDGYRAVRTGGESVRRVHRNHMWCLRSTTFAGQKTKQWDLGALVAPSSRDAGRHPCCRPFSR